MENLFSTTIGINGKNINYRVVFNDDKYIFISEAEQSEFSTFSFKRENDQWMDQELMPPGIKNQALDALEKYLLTQH